MTDIKMFGDRIRVLREQKAGADPSFTLRKFAQAVGLSPTFISKMERNEFAPPKAENIKKMAVLLGCDADELLALANKVDPELETIIKENPAVVPDLLRTVRGMPAEQVKSVKVYAEMRKNED